MKLGVTYIPVHINKHIQADMRELKKIGCSDVLFALSENNIFILEGSWKHGAEIAKDNGLHPSAVVWGYVNSFGGGRISRILLNDTEMWIQDRQGKIAPQACFNNPKIWLRFLEIGGLLYENGFEAIFVDEPSLQECWCSHCRNKFHQLYGLDLEENDESKEYQKFRQDNIVDYVKIVCDLVKKNFPGLTTMACIMPEDRASWDKIAAIDNLDDFGTDPYWLLEAAHLTLTEGLQISRECHELAKNNHKLSHIWLNAWKIRSGYEKEIYTGGLELARTGHDSLFTWSYLGGSGTNEESENPKLVWKNVSRLYQDLSGKI